MLTRFVEKPEVELGDPTVAKGSGRGRRTIGRVLTELAITFVAVGFGLNCLTLFDLENPTSYSSFARPFLAYSLLFLAARVSWILLNILNDACERACDYYWPMPSRAGRKPEPLDDL